MAGDPGRGSRRPATERADELLTRVGWTAGLFASIAGTHIARVAAFAREEAEDMWAEAQNMRRQNGVKSDAAASQATGSSRENAEETRERATIRPAHEGATEHSVAPDGGTASVKATETARRLAKELGVDLEQTSGTGTGGQITAADVRKQAKANFVG